MPRWWKFVAAPVVLAAVAGGGLTAWPGSPASSHAEPTTTTITRPAPQPLTVSATIPTAGASEVDGSQPVTITFNQPLAVPATPPTIAPAVAGRWSTSGNNLTFTPTGAFPPDTTVTVSVPAGRRSAQGSTLQKSVTVSFRTAGGSVLALDEALAYLNYLPLTFTPSAPAAAPASTAARQRAMYHPPAGTFSWSWSSVPPSLAAAWAQGEDTVMIKGAVMAFEAGHGLTVDGVAGPQVWNALTTTTVANPHGYTYALASKARPETLTVWHDATIVEQTRANTGIPQAPTSDGTFPVYERLASQVMKGTNPNGTRYADQVEWVAYFNGNDAVHYMPRASYGYPQSVGCVELPWAPAKAVWPYLTLGTLVTVAG